ncbi:hypothetical protein Tco_0299775 [Tanacetum coccineum]
MGGADGGVAAVMVFEYEHAVMNPTSAGMRHHHLSSLCRPERKQLALKRGRIWLCHIVGSIQKNLFDRVSSLKQSRKSPTAVLFDETLKDYHSPFVNTKSITLKVLAESQGNNA